MFRSVRYNDGKITKNEGDMITKSNSMISRCNDIGEYTIIMFE